MFNYKASFKLNFTATDPILESCTEIIELDVIVTYMYIITELLNYLTPLAALLTVWTYRDELLEIFFKNTYEFRRRDIIKAGSNYKK